MLAPRGPKATSPATDNALIEERRSTLSSSQVNSFESASTRNTPPPTNAPRTAPSSPGSRRGSGRAVVRSHTHARDPTVTALDESGSKATSSIAPRWAANMVEAVPEVARSWSRTVQSALADANRVPSGEKTAWWTLCRWSSNSAVGREGRGDLPEEHRSVVAGGRAELRVGAERDVSNKSAVGFECHHAGFARRGRAQFDDGFARGRARQPAAVRTHVEGEDF